MMEPSNLDHQHQDELHGVPSSSPSPSFHLVGGNHEWNHNLIVNDGDFIPSISGVLSRDFRLGNDQITSPALSTHMVQDLGFCWGGNAEGYMNRSSHQTRTKGGLSDPFPKISGNYNLASTSFKHEQQGLHELDHEGSFLKTLASGCEANGLQPLAGDLLIGASRGNYSMVLPSANIPSMNPPLPSPYQASLGLDLQALDLLASARFGRSFGDLSSFNSMNLIKEEPSNSHYKVSPLVGGLSDSKRGSFSTMEHKDCQSTQKKTRFETRSSFSPFKVRKEKLGDRIAALQQLVAPFGKTDTASVLMEAIGYIKFLQDQVETLSVPYMKSPHNLKLRTIQGGSSEDTAEAKPDLRSRGLCLVPLSYTSYVTNENGGVWSQPNYRGSN